MCSPRIAEAARTSAPARPKRRATPYSGASDATSNVTAYQVVAHVSTQTAKSCQLARRCIAGKPPGSAKPRGASETAHARSRCGRSVERDRRVPRRADAQRAVDAFDHDRVHAERDLATDARIGTVAREHVGHGMALRARG